jgi:hypothetical protein
LNRAENLKEERIYGVQLISTKPLIFDANGHTFEVIEEKLTKLKKS